MSEGPKPGSYQLIAAIFWTIAFIVLFLAFTRFYRPFGTWTWLAATIYMLFAIGFVIYHQRQKSRPDESD